MDNGYPLDLLPSSGQAKAKSIFELAENLSLVLTKLENDLGLAQPQLVTIRIFRITKHQYT